MNRKYKICILTYGKLFEIACKVADSMEYDDTEIMLMDSNVDTVEQAVEAAAAKGCEIFIAGGANAVEFRRFSRHHLVELRPGSVDYLKAIKKALEIGSHPAIVAHRYARYVDIALLEELFDISIEMLLYEDSDELYNAIQNCRGDVIIGTSQPLKIAAELNKKSVLLYYSEDTIRNAIRRAHGIAQDMEQNILNKKINQAIVTHAPFGITVCDVDGYVLLFNRMIRQQTGLESARVSGRLLADLVPALDPMPFLKSDEAQTDQKRLINGAMLRCSQTRITDREKTIAVMTTVYPDNTRRNKNSSAEQEPYRAHFSWKDAIGRSPSMTALIQEAKRLAASPYPIMITGEAGVGKAFIAQCIHNGSLRADGPYISINTASLAKEDAARTLFGSEDMSGVHPGLLELAESGTVAIRDLEYASETVQSCLLQVLTERQFRRVGGNTQIPLRAGIITIVDDAGARAGIRENLWQRLSVHHLHVPALRERKEDILELFLYLFRESGVTGRWIGQETEKLLCFYSWPGNLTEMSSVCKRFGYSLRQVEKPSPSVRQNMLIQAIGEETLFQEFLQRYPCLLSPGEAEPAELVPILDEMKHVLKYNNQTIADKLSMSRTTLWRIKKVTP